MIAPYDPHGWSAAVPVGRVGEEYRKRSKGMMIIPLDPYGYSAVAAGGVVIFWRSSGGSAVRSRGGAGIGPEISKIRSAEREKYA